ncbi:hypothetical protein DPMN_163036 [Dreissena polymorpha]|uniref:Uncharacterized protein n=1 Tax=Dreissena polymorpha TaxID=45954 RepID=A0A9D4ET78_DREPO|nr:hypothetical protein DPMN_163036 [Dreissena polymorpha]
MTVSTLCATTHGRKLSATMTGLPQRDARAIVTNHTSAGKTTTALESAVQEPRVTTGHVMARGAIIRKQTFTGSHTAFSFN